VRHRTAPVHEHADRPADVAADLGELAGELVGDQAVGRKVAAVEALERADLAGLEALGVAEDADVSGLPKSGPTTLERRARGDWESRSRTGGRVTQGSPRGRSPEGPRRLRAGPVALRRFARAG
jgi:hypothetical protein